MIEMIRKCSWTHKEVSQFVRKSIKNHYNIGPKVAEEV